jgi:hypothetical protein
MTIDEARELVDSKIRYKNYEYVVAKNDAYSIVTKIVDKMQAEIDNLARENSKYEAKIYAYEAILQNSNFKMAVMRKKEEA